MKGYAYLDVEGGLHYKPASYIDNDNPAFWMDNSYLILIVWKFDTEDLSSMLQMYSKFKELKLKSDVVLNFSTAIKFNIASLTSYANSL
jgi:hypothetical protein